MAEHEDDRHAHDGEDGHGQEPEERWGDYNAESPGPSNLPVIGPGALLVYGLALAAMVGAISFYSVKVTNARRPAVPHDAQGKTHGEAKPSVEPSHE